MSSFGHTEIEYFWDNNDEVTSIVLRGATKKKQPLTLIKRLKLVQ